MRHAVRFVVSSANVQYSAVQYSAVQYSAVQRSAVQRSASHPRLSDRNCLLLKYNQFVLIFVLPMRSVVVVVHWIDLAYEPDS